MSFGVFMCKYLTDSYETSGTKKKTEKSFADCMVLNGI